MLQTIETILVPINFSETSDSVLASAKVFAGHFQSRIIVAHVGELFPPAMEEFVQDINFDAVSEQAQVTLQQQLERYVQKHLPDWDTQAIVRIGEAHAEILKIARSHDVSLIMMATQSRGGMTQAILGSNTERVLRGSPCPVLAIPV